MHLTMEELLDVRDGESRPEAAAHAASCPVCAAEVERLKEMRAALRALPLLRPEGDRWPLVRGAVERRRRRNGALAVGGAALAMAASLVLALLLPGTTPAPLTDRGTSRNEISDLVAESQRLEEALRALGPERRVMDVWQVSALEDPEDEIGFVDMRLVGPGARSLPPEEAVRLWRRRVDLMNELLRARGGQTVYVGL